MGCVSQSAFQEQHSAITDKTLENQNPMHTTVLRLSELLI